MKLVFKSTVLLVAVALQLGCASSSTDSIGAIRPGVDAHQSEADKALAQQRKKERVGFVSHTKESWLPLKKVDRVVVNSPKDRSDRMDFETSENFRNLGHLVNEISSRTGIPVSIAQDVPMSPQALPGGAQVPGSPMGAPTPGGMPGAPLPGMPSYGAPGMAQNQAQNQTQNQAQISGASPYRAQYAGKLSGFMDVVASYYGISWRAEPGALRFYYLDSKTFRVKALPGDTKLSSQVGSGSGNPNTGSNNTSNQAGTSSSTTGVTFDGLSVWTALEKSIAQQLTPTVGKVYVSSATGTVTVKDTPLVLERIAKFIDDQNESLSRQVAIYVRVLTVDVSDTEEYGINWNAVYTSLADTAGVSLKTGFPSSAGAANVVFSVVDPTGTSRWNGTQAMINALSTQGRVSELTSASLTTINNQAAPVNVGRRVSYLASSATTTTANVGSTTTLTPGTVDTGFAMTLVPHILDKDELMLQYSMDLSSLLKMNTITSGGASIQAPDISTSNFIQRIRMNSGETLVVAGFDQSNLSAVSQGVGTPDNPVAGGRAKSNTRSMLVILIQPIVSPQPMVAQSSF